MSVELRYPGHRPFLRADSGRFFGRAEEAAALAAAWLRNRLTFVSGPAGVGKSSLVAAGVLPLVNRSNVELLPIGGFSHGSSSPIAPPGPHTPYTLALLRSWSPSGAGLAFDPFTVDEFVADRIKQLDPSRTLLAVIDQADDLFAGPSSRQPQRQRFLRELADALENPALRLLICVRDEALHRFADVLGPGGAHIEVRALEPAQAHEAVTGPGCFRPEAARELVAALRTSLLVTMNGTERRVVADRVEPALLQAVCARLWELLRRHSSLITVRELRRYADIEDALASYCGAAIAAVAQAYGIQVPWLRFWLIGTFISTAGGSLDVAEEAAAAAGLPPTVARALEDRHLLRARAGPAAGPAAAQASPSRVYRLISDRVIEPLRHTPDDMAPDGDPAGHLRAAERALTVGELSLAARYAELARLAAPDTDLVLHARARSLLGNIAREERELVRAEAHYREALALFAAATENSMVALLLVAIGRILIERGDLLGGISELHAAVRRMPADATIQTELSAAVRELGWRLAGQHPRIRPS